MKSANYSLPKLIQRWISFEKSFKIQIIIKVREQIYLIFSNIICIEFPHSKILEKILSLYDLNNNINTEHIFKAVYIIFKNLVKEIRKNKPNYIKFIQDYFFQKAYVFKNLLDLSIAKMREFGFLLENSDDIQTIDKISQYMNENLLKFSLKMLNLEVLVTNVFESEKYIKQMDFFQNLGRFLFF